MQGGPPSKWGLTCPTDGQGHTQGGKTRQGNEGQQEMQGWWHNAHHWLHRFPCLLAGAVRTIPAQHSNTGWVVSGLPQPGPSPNCAWAAVAKLGSGRAEGPHQPSWHLQKPVLQSPVRCQSGRKQAVMSESNLAIHVHPAPWHMLGMSSEWNVHNARNAASCGMALALACPAHHARCTD